jgi:bacterioferritin-associated ferredoxin
MTSDEILDAIAHIELRRQDIEKTAGVAAACNEALRKLHELLGHEEEAMQAHGPGARHAANIEALKGEIERVKNLAAVGGRVATRRHEPAQGQKPMRQAQAHNRPRTKGRRTMGRGSGR